jgi:thiamine kinase-like enzyme
MHIEMGEAIESFQQKVWRATADGKPVFIKEIVSNCSWWTFDESDVYQREKLSYQILNTAGIGPRLLSSDDMARRLVIEEIADTPNEDDKAACDHLLELLKTLRGLRNTGLDRLTARRLAAHYTQKGQAAGVHPRFLEEISQQLETWHRIYGEELCFTHGDLHIGNLRSGGNRILGLIDFEESIESLPVFDGVNMADALSEAPELCAHFAESYEKLFDEPLIPLKEWRRFWRLRGWIVSCYLQNCAAPNVREKARSFIFSKALDG